MQCMSRIYEHHFGPGRFLAPPDTGDLMSISAAKAEAVSFPKAIGTYRAPQKTTKSNCEWI